MTTQSQDRLLGIAVASLIAAFGGDLLGMSLLVTVGVASFFLAVAALLALMTASLVVGLSQLSGPDMHAPVPAEKARFPTLDER
ncbi:hypothetical protein [Halorubrum sp. FL23]|uniref:hypothetical protein n=1 Tax=Halorubrum sp. FL23 TaxID=3458704 RepID=UPI004034A548